MDRMHLMSLSVGVKDADFSNTFDDLSDMQRRLGQMHSYCSLSVNDFNDVMDEETESGEDLYADEDTLRKVHNAMRDVMFSQFGTAHDDVIENLINDLQNVGILFRERRS